MRDRLAGKYTASTYQAFVFNADDVCLIFYPHKVKSTHNHHIRIRDQHSPNTERANELIFKLEEAAGPNCTFTTKHFTMREYKYGKKRGQK